jgi:hypothetical protein
MKNDNFFESLCINTGIVEGIMHTGESQILNYENAMPGDDYKNWMVAIDEEHDRIIENNIWIPRKFIDFPVNAKLLTLTWAMKKKSNGQYRARIIPEVSFRKTEYTNLVT